MIGKLDLACYLFLYSKLRMILPILVVEKAKESYFVKFYFVKMVVKFIL